MTTAAEVSEVRRRLRADGPRWTRNFEHDVEVVTLPERDCDILRDLLIREGVATIVLLPAYDRAAGRPGRHDDTWTPSVRTAVRYTSETSVGH